MSPLLSDTRRTIPAQKNPLDKCTIVSVYPKFIRAVKHTIQPGVFEIAIGKPDAPVILVVGSSSWWKETDIHSPLLEIPNSSIQVASSVVTDYCNGLLGASVPDAMPGLFFVMGEHTVKDIKDKFKNELAQAIARQNNWYRALVGIADTNWARTNGNPLVISDDMRMAAVELNLKNKDWMRDFQSMEQVRCIACGTFRNPAFPICGSCKAIVDKDKAKEMNLTFAQ